MDQGGRSRSFNVIMILLLASSSQLNGLVAIHGLTQLVLIIFGLHNHSNLWCLWCHRMQEWRLLLDLSDKYFWWTVFKDPIIVIPWNVVSILHATFIFKDSIVTNTRHQLSKSLAWIVIDQVVVGSWVATLIIVVPFGSSRLIMIYFKLIIYLLLLLSRLKVLNLLHLLVLFLRLLYLMQLLLLLFLTLMNNSWWLYYRHHVFVGIAVVIIWLQL